MNIKKVPGFTLTEMLIVLAISTIVVGLAFTIITLFSKNVRLIQNNYQSTTNTHLFNQQLALDFNRYPTINYNNLEEELVFKSPLDSVRYKFLEECVLRDLDTLIKTTYQKQFFFSGEKVSLGKIDAIKLIVPTNKQLFIYKENDAFSYLNGN